MFTHDISFQELRDAIEDLAKSTAAIEKQNNILRLKQKALNEMITHKNRTEMLRLQTNQSQSREWDKEYAESTKAVGTLPF